MALRNVLLDKQVYTTEEIDEKIGLLTDVDLSDVVKQSDFPEDEDEDRSVLLDVYPYQDLDSVQLKKAYHVVGDGIKEKSFEIEGTDGVNVNVVSEHVVDDEGERDVVKLKFDAKPLMDKIGAVEEVLDKILSSDTENSLELEALIDKILGTE